ncbi:uncharacterized protein V6R79_010743 [Siganus canaliculatus]
MQQGRWAWFTCGTVRIRKVQQSSSLHPSVGSSHSDARPNPAHLNSPTMWWRSPRLHLLLSLLFLLVEGATARDFRICAYNLQKFNKQKASNHRVAHTLTRIVYRCDIALLQEVMDPDSIKALIVSLNRYDDFSYESVSSQRLGNAPSAMEQYTFIYRTDTVKVTAQHQYQKKDAFIRAPFAVEFESKKTAVKKFVLVPLRSEPHRAVQEIDHLYDVFEEVIQKWNNTNVMFLGDFHAGCAYLTRPDKKKIRLFTDSRFSWMIGDKVDTTASDDTSCPYDRIVVHGNKFLKAVAPFSAKVFDFGKEFKLPRSKVLELSDHLPVQVILKGSAPLLQATPLLLILITVVQYFLPAL